MYLVEGVLIICIVLIILYILYLYFHRQGILIFKYHDIPPESFEDTTPAATPTPKSTLTSNTDYKQFYEWHANFCTTWNKVIEQSMSTDNYKGNPVDYVANLEQSQSKQFVKCYSEITADPEPLAIESNKIPTVELYLSTMNYMASKIASILQKTKDALAGNPQPEGFECGCLSPETVASLEANIQKSKTDAENKAKAITKILTQIKPIIKDKASLDGQLAIINRGLNELLEYKRKAESGEIVNDIKIPS